MLESPGSGAGRDPLNWSTNHNPVLILTLDSDGDGMVWSRFFPLKCSIATLTLLALWLPSILNAATATPKSGFSIGNGLISLMFGRSNQLKALVALKSQTRIPVRSRGFGLTCQIDNRDWLLSRDQGMLSGVKLEPSGRSAVISWSFRNPSLEVRVHYELSPSQPYIFKWLVVVNRGSSIVNIKRIILSDLQLIHSSAEPFRGGTGQPVFLHDSFFLGVEDPAATNYAMGDDIVLSYYADDALSPAAAWRSQRSVFGATATNDQSVEDAFRQYLVAITGRGSVYRPIYVDWAAHDELGTLVKPKLTEQLTDSMLDLLQSMKLRDGIQFQYYLVDGFWYSTRGAYITFKEPNWPRGFEPTRKRMLALGMKPGLWFDISCSPHPGSHDLYINLKETPSWRGPAKPCLYDPELSQFLGHAMTFHIREDSLGLLKFDFANMLCHHGDRGVPSLAMVEKNADALLGVIQKIRRLNPAIVIRAYNGFSSGEMMGSTENYDRAYPISPWWVLWFDSVYSGDPRPADLPSYTSLRDSIVWYQDHMVRGYMRSLMPAFTIDDSGTLVGRTSTIYYIGARGFTDSWIMNIMRGNLAPELYGDLRLLTKDDRKFIAATLNLLRTYQGVIARTRPILGVPGRGQVYGYLASGKNLAFVTVVNPGLYPQTFLVGTPPSLPPGSLTKLLFSNDGDHREPVRPVRGELSGILIPGEIRVYALGTDGQIAPLWLPPAPTRRYHHVTPFDNPFAAGRKASIRITPSDIGKTLAFVIQYRKNGQPNRSYIWPENVLKVSGTLNSHPVLFSTIPAEGTDIWSKCSWAVLKHEVSSAEKNKTLRLTLIGSPPAGTQWRIKALWLK